MKPIEFKESNVTFAKDQPEYLPLHAYRSDDGEVISCWKLTFGERLKVLFTGKVFLQILTFNKPLQPSKIVISNPFKLEGESDGSNSD